MTRQDRPREIGISVPSDAKHHDTKARAFRSDGHGTALVSQAALAESSPVVAAAHLRHRLRTAASGMSREAQRITAQGPTSL